ISSANHIGIKQMQLITKRSSLTDVAITAKDLLNILFKPQILFISFVCRTEKINTSIFPSLQRINTPRKQGGLGPMKIPLLSDLTHQISKDYGVYLEDQGHTLRGLFIIDNKRILRQITMNDLPVGRSVDETLRLVQAFQYTDKHGEVCPAGWKPGSETVSHCLY
uniref:thioredoxin-dependent peroxiredoxin n=1 Tax=Serinus canaria TaxID=9135 RepID=A0A8C9NR64_SERCA